MLPDSESDYRRLLARSIGAIAAGSLAVAVCYQWVDRPVALAVERYGTNQIAIFKLLTEPPPVIERFCPLVLAMLVVLRAWRPFARWELTLLVACLCLIVADEFRESIGDLCGRYWPETWFDHNPSFIGTGAYGFHPWQAGDDVGSFPSGHAARVVGFAAVWWLAVPRSRAICLVVCPPLLVALVLMNYHFVGDVVGGSVVGAIVAAWGARLAKLTGEATPPGLIP
ncbi:MAG: phosphatase PAP2 family protein [Pirellulales bacterium]